MQKVKIKIEKVRSNGCWNRDEATGLSKKLRREERTEQGEKEALK